jgi:hypothetical protein
MARKKRSTDPPSGPFGLSVDEGHAGNAWPLAWLSTHASAQGKRLGLIAAPARVRDPYMSCGAHPDIVERVWEQLGRALPRDGRCLIFGTPALVHAEFGVLLAVCLGTAYVVRLPPDAAPPPRRCVVMQGSDGGRLDLESEFGAGWMFGDFSPGEVDALKACYGESR